MEVISLKMDKNLLDGIDHALEQYRYSTRTELIREAIRDKLTQLEKDDLKKLVVSLKGCLKGKAKMSDKQAAKITEKEYLKKFGIKI